LAEQVQRRVQNIRTDLNVFSPAEVQLLIYQGYAAACRANDGAAAIPGFQFTPGHMPFPLPQPGGSWLPYAIGDKRVDPDALHAARKSDRTRPGLFAWWAPLFYVNCLLLFLLLGLLYPSLMAWAWIGNLLFPNHAQEHPPLDVTYLSRSFYEKWNVPSYIQTLANACEDSAENNQPNKVDRHAVVFKVGPFSSSGPQPIADFKWVGSLSPGLTVNQRFAFVVSQNDSKERKRYEPIDPAEVVQIQPDQLGVHVPRCEGDAFLLILLSVSRADKAPLPLSAKDILLTSEVKP
jgi:hypothetical protein